MHLKSGLAPILRPLLRCFAIVLIFSAIATRSQVIVSDDFNVAGSGTGFALGSGINSGVNPPTTRLNGSAAANLRYISTGTKASTAFSIAGNKLQVTSAANPGRFTLSANGTNPFDFATALGADSASPQSPAVYDLAISMANNTPGTQRFSFALGTAEGDATTWDFGIQIFRTASSDQFYTVGKRIDTKASGLSSDLNIFITNTVVGTYGSEISILMRVTDAGSESSAFHSRVQLSMDGGLNRIYDTASDPDLPSGWRLNGTGRYIMWDVAPDAGNVTYDSFSVRKVPISASLISPANNALGLGAAPTLSATISNLSPGDVTVTFFGRQPPKPGPGPDFLIPVLPDTQNYAREAAGSGDATKEMWFAQTEWIITNRVSQNIAYVATLGDCVQNGDVLNGNPNSSEWKNATNAMYRLENPSRTLLGEGIPYGITVGNHDQDPNGDPDGTTSLYNQYFGTSHFQDKTYYGGHYSTNNDSWYDLFSAGGLDFLVISFEYGRYGSTVLNWARNLMDTYPTRRVIVLTHHAGDDTPDDSTSSPLSTQGSAIYTALRTNANFFLMLGGHVFNEGGEGRRTDTFQGHSIRTLISDYQGRFNGGNGLMRLMYFSPTNNLVSVKTYSPYTDNYETDANSQFSFSYNMQPNGAGSAGTPYVALGTNLNVAGGPTSFAWRGLSANKTYEWYVKVTDSSGASFITSPRQFSTGPNTAPIASNQTVTVTGDTSTQLTLSGTDANGDALTFTTNSAPLHGTLTNFNPTNGTIVYQPTPGYRGADQFIYRASDSVATSGNATMSINVIAPPVPPTFVSQPASLVVWQGSNAVFEASAVGEDVSYQWFFDSEAIAQATNATLTLSDVQPTNVGSYFVTASNFAGSTNSNVATLQIVPDSFAPSLTVTSPGKNKSFIQSAIQVVGLAKDSGTGNSGIIKSVTLSVNGGSVQTATLFDLGKGTWSFSSAAPIALSPGTNTLDVWAKDLAGNETHVNVPFFYDMIGSLTLNVVGPGTVKMGTNVWNSGTVVVTNLLKVGRAYRFDAFVLKGSDYVFTNWFTEPENVSISTNLWVQKSSLPFVMQSNMVITANFVTNPFTRLAGTYNGLFFDETNGVTHETAGFIQVKVKDKSSYTGFLLFDGDKRSFSGKFNMDGTVDREVSRSKPPVKPSVQLTLNLSDETMTGSVSGIEDVWSSQVFANKAVFNDKTIPPVLETNFDGNYTLQFPQSPGAPQQSPGGVGFGTVSNSPGGMIKFGGTLSDGEKVVQKVNISPTGEWPFYAGLYKTSAKQLKGSIMGWLAFTNHAFSPATGNVVTWIKKDGSEVQGRYPNGFSNILELAGSPYVAPGDLENPIQISGGRVILFDGNLAAPITNLITSITNKKISLSPSSTAGALNKMTIVINKKNGTFTGGFLNPTAKTSFQGVLLQNSTNASGFFLGTNESGTVRLEGN